jgi:hypothetical protein
VRIKVLRAIESRARQRAKLLGEGSRQIGHKLIGLGWWTHFVEVILVQAIAVATFHRAFLAFSYPCNTTLLLLLLFLSADAFSQALIHVFVSV